MSPNKATCRVCRREEVDSADFDMCFKCWMAFRRIDSTSFDTKQIRQEMIRADVPLKKSKGDTQRWHALDEAS